MSEPYDRAHAPQCTCDIKTGYIDGDTDTVYCIKCDGVIANTNYITMANIAEWNLEFNKALHYGHEGLDVRNEHEVYCSECEEVL